MKKTKNPAACVIPTIPQIPCYNALQRAFVVKKYYKIYKSISKYYNTLATNGDFFAGPKGFYYFCLLFIFWHIMNTENFDPNGTGQDNGNYFGLPFTPDEAKLVLLSIPWDVTASYGGGAAFGPDAIIGASTQLDLYDAFNPQGWRCGIGTIGIDYSIQDRSSFLREDAVKVMKHLEQGGSLSNESIRRRTERINEACRTLNETVYEEAKEWLAQGKRLGLVGGDHSTPLGAIRAIAEHDGPMGILHIDAHADLRIAYEGFEYSHASIMYNVMTQVEGIEKLVQVGVRDYCNAEQEFAQQDPRIETFYDDLLASRAAEGMTWQAQCAEILEKLPERVYISFDIDGLSPENCPHTGTPVPGGLSFREAVYLLHKVADSGRRIVGFDLCEVAPAHDNEWDANVGARILYKLCNVTLKTDL